MTSKPSLYKVPQSKTSKPPPPSNPVFTSTLSSLLAKPPNNTSHGRPRPSKTPKPSIFTSHNRGTKKRALADIADDGLARPQAHSQSSEAVDAATLTRSKRKMEEKAALYARMKKGEYVPPGGGRVDREAEGLVDFDRKWVEEASAGREAESESSEASAGEEDEAEETVEYEDEFGRLRTGTKSTAAKELQRLNARAYASQSLLDSSARPPPPPNLIHGDTIQSAAFNPDEPHSAQMETLARKRDRSLTPPEEVHYDARTEVRSKGVGFYQFSRDREGREREMEALREEREETERGRREAEERVERRKAEVEERRRRIVEMRERKLADRFLEELDRG